MGKNNIKNPPFNISDLLKKTQDILRAKKKDFSKIYTGDQIRMPDFYVKAPEPIQKLLGMDGYPSKRITQISGAPNSGKTSLAMHAMVEAQRQGMAVLFVDTEGKFSKDRFQKMGGSPELISVVNATTIEQGWCDAIELLNVWISVKPDVKILFVWDSIGQTPSAMEADANPDEKIQLASAAKANKSNIKVFNTQWVDKHNIVALLINTNYCNIGSHGRKNSGGEGVEYSSCIIVQLNRKGDLIKQVKGQKVVYGIETKAKITKNHLMSEEYTLKEIDFCVEAYGIRLKTDKKKD